MLPLRTLFLLALLSLSFVSPAQIKPLTYIDVHSFRVHKADLEKVTVIVELRFYNPNSIGVTLKDGNIDAWFNNKYLGKGIVDEQTKVPARDTFLVPVAITATLESVFTNALDILSSDKKKVLVKLEGSIKAGKAGIFIKVPVKYEGEEGFEFLSCSYA